MRLNPLLFLGIALCMIGECVGAVILLGIPGVIIVFIGALAIAITGKVEYARVQIRPGERSDKMEDRKILQGPPPEAGGL